MVKEQSDRKKYGNLNNGTRVLKFNSTNLIETFASLSSIDLNLEPHIMELGTISVMNLFDEPLNQITTLIVELIVEGMHISK
jgi:hypothetical protein